MRLATDIKAAAKPHCAYVFANKRANRMKILLCDGFGLWLLARRLHQGRFVWSALRTREPVLIDDLQLQALAIRRLRLCDRPAVNNTTH